MKKFRKRTLTAKWRDAKMIIVGTKECVDGGVLNERRCLTNDTCKRCEKTVRREGVRVLSEENLISIRGFKSTEKRGVSCNVEVYVCRSRDIEKFWCNIGLRKLRILLLMRECVCGGTKFGVLFRRVHCQVRIER